MSKGVTMKIKRNYKDSTFRKLFNDKERLIELYNALSGSNYSKDTEIEIITFDDAIMGNRKGDVVFQIDGKIIVFMEHQSTINPNMPLRVLIYIAKEYEKEYFGKDIYSKKRVMIPTPEAYVFYNGTEDAPVTKTLKLSDSYIKKCDKMSLEVKVDVININHEKGAKILKRCKTLNDYSLLIHTIREKEQNGKELDIAIEETIIEFINQGILVEFLKENGGEIMSFLFEELTREECEAIREQDGYFRGKEEGIKETSILIAKKMKEKGEDLEKIALYTNLSVEEIENA